MPLHLLGKKSWHVYNSDNVERVRRDEAEAQAREEAEEQRQQQEDAEYRTKLLRGERPDPPSREIDAVSHDKIKVREKESDYGRQRKRRRLYGEDDTDRDIRWAKEDADVGNKVAAVLSKRPAADIPLQDRDGHIQLVPVPDAKEAGMFEKNAEVEAEKARRKRQDEDQYTMRFSNAAGFKNNLQAPWYADKSSNAERSAMATSEKDVWGNEDPRRREREQKRTTSNDPLAFMQQAQRQLKQSEKDRDRWRVERDAELRDLKREERKRRHRRDDELESFNLDAKPERKTHERSHHSHRRDGIPAFSLDDKKVRNSHERSRHHDRRRRRSRSRSRD